MKISVIIPTFKPKEYIWECLDSLVNQTLSYNRFEVLIILNGCNKPWSDNIEQYCYIHKDVNFRFFQINQAGVSNARNLGLDNAKGEYVTFIDDDDYVSNMYLERLLDIAEQGYLPISNIIAFEDITRTVKPYYISKIFQKRKNAEVLKIMQIRSYFSVPVCKLLNLKDIGNRRYDQKFKNGEDSIFMFLISDKIDKIKCTDEDVIYYRRYRDNSATTMYRSQRNIINNSILLIKVYSQIFWGHLGKYNFLFYCTRVLAALKKIVIS